jgi:hypothetical protein
MLAMTGGDFLPLRFALVARDAEFVPGELMLRHEFAGQFFGPGTKWKSGSNVADRAGLHAGETIHIRFAPVEFVIPIRRMRVREPDHASADVLVEVSFEVERDPQR